MRTLLALGLAAALTACGSDSLSPPSNVTGYWSGQMDANASQNFQMYLTQTGTQLTGTVFPFIQNGNVTEVVETVPVTGSLDGANITLTSTCDTCSAFVQLSGRFVNGLVVHATLTGGNPSGKADFRFIGHINTPG